jgi:DNA/RNA endonuclease G (NUC1)
MDAIAVPDSIWKALYTKAKDGDTNYKTWLQYASMQPNRTT